MKLFLVIGSKKPINPNVTKIHYVEPEIELIANGKPIGSIIQFDNESTKISTKISTNYVMIDWTNLGCIDGNQLIYLKDWLDKLNLSLADLLSAVDTINIHLSYKYTTNYNTNVEHLSVNELTFVDANGNYMNLCKQVPNTPGRKINIINHPL